MTLYGIPWSTILLLVLSNLFMTIAWCGHLKFHQAMLWQAILASWAIAFLEYCFQVPANCIGYAHHIAPSQLKVMQEAITLVVFSGFTMIYFKEQLHWKHAISFLLLIGAVFFAFQKA